MRWWWWVRRRPSASSRWSTEDEEEEEEARNKRYVYICPRDICARARVSVWVAIRSLCKITLLLLLGPFAAAHTTTATTTTTTTTTAAKIYFLLIVYNLKTPFYAVIARTPAITYINRRIYNYYYY